MPLAKNRGHIDLHIGRSVHLSVCM